MGAFRYVADRYLDGQMKPETVRDVYARHRVWARHCDAAKLHRIARDWIYLDPSGYPQPVQYWGHAVRSIHGDSDHVVELTPENPRHARAFIEPPTIRRRVGSLRRR